VHLCDQSSANGRLALVVFVPMICSMLPPLQPNSEFVLSGPYLTEPQSFPE